MERNTWVGNYKVRKTPFLEQAASDVGYTISFGEPLQRRDGGFVKSSAADAEGWRALFIADVGDTTPFWNRVAELEAEQA